MLAIIYEEVVVLNLFTKVFISQLEQWTNCWIRWRG